MHRTSSGWTRRKSARATTVTLIDAKRPPEWVKETCLAKRYRPTQLVGELAGIRTDRGIYLNLDAWVRRF
jgi:hypothetical protein